MSDTSDRSSLGAGIKTGVVALAVAGAVYFGFIRSAEEKQLDTPESAGAYVCLECNEPFSLTPAGYERLSKSGGVQSVGDGEARGGQLRFRCPKCQKISGVPALRCPNDDSHVPNMYVKGQPSKCPRCGWAP